MTADKIDFAKKQDEFAARLEQVSAWLNRLSFPEIGDVGKAFAARFARTGCRERYDVKMPGYGAHYISSTAYLQRGSVHVNEIRYAFNAAATRQQLFAIRVHEATHAIQGARAASIHALPLNYPKTGICFAPEDMLLVNERKEQDAFVTQAWFSAMMARHEPALYDDGGLFALSVGTFEKILAGTGTLQKSFRHAAAAIMRAEEQWDGSPRRMRLDDHYARNFLTQMPLMFKSCVLTGGKLPTLYCRAEEEDIREIGSSFGLNTFGQTAIYPEFLKPAYLSTENGKALAEINAQLGIKSRDELPNFSEALAMRGLDRKRFLAICRDEMRPKFPDPF